MKFAKKVSFCNQLSISRVNLQCSWVPSLHSSVVCMPYWTYLSQHKDYKLFGRVLDMTKFTVSLTHWIKLALINLMCGDVEKNSQPYHFVSVVRVINQNHEEFWTSRGIKCTCTRLYSVYFSIIKPIFKWNLKDLEYMIVTGYDQTKRRIYYNYYHVQICLSWWMQKICKSKLHF